MASELERIAEDCRLRAAEIVHRLDELNERTAAKSRELAEDSASAMREFWQEMAEKQQGDRSAGPDGQGDKGNEQSHAVGRRPDVESLQLLDAESKGPDEEQLRRRQAMVRPVGDAGVPVQSSYEGDHRTGATSDEFDRREAIARSAAARRRNSVVAPIDDDGDDEAEYYRRNSWLV
ncbi:hypothetical protein [Nocardia sp. NPDC003963]